MSQVNIDTKELEKMIKNAADKAVKNELPKFVEMASNIAEIRRVLVGDDYDKMGVVDKVNKMWNDYLIWRWLLTFFGITNLGGVIALIMLFKQVFG